ncbi:testicular spindle-associated protein SHCBP1L-like [Brachyhypopomus gauderio]|uniref:testicular spindle-associated protein SHCBP1L-like n=1 Tax=Brachyhypopomus gauderio TaxID=698409 RepID=UPI0040427D10
MATWFPHDVYQENTVECDKNENDSPCADVSPEETADKDTEESPNGDPDYTDEAKTPPQIYTSKKSLTHEDRVSLFCDEIFRWCSTAEEADEAIALFINEKIVNKRSWTAIWKTAPEGRFGNCDTGELPYIGVLVQVNATPYEGKALPLRVSVSVAEPFSANIATLPREMVEDVLKEQDYLVSILDAYPIEGLGPDVDSIAEALEHARFFYDFLSRDWDIVEECQDYAGLIEKRLQLYSDIEDGTIPGPIIERYRKTLEKYHSKQQQLSRLQKSILGEATLGQTVDSCKIYFEMSQLSGLLQFWEDLRLRSHGPFYPKVYKRRKGHRASGKKVAHIVAQVMTTDMIKTLTSDTLIQQHECLAGALETCFSGDSVVIFPGEHQADALASLTDDILIMGFGKRQDVVINSDPSQYNFVASKGSQVTIQDLTLVQKGTCDGIVVVESGHMTLQNCVLKCEGTGVRVLTGASLNMTDCEITGAQGAGIELSPGSVAELHRNEIHHCSSQASKDLKSSLGGINMKVLPQPQLKMSKNYIHDNHGYGVTILVADHQGRASENQPTAGGDKNESDHLVRAMQKLSVDVSHNKLESNSMGEVGVLHKMWVSS